MCHVLMQAPSYHVYWLLQEPKPKRQGTYLIWPEHKIDPVTQNCVRCGHRILVLSLK